MTARLRSQADVWVDALALSDEALAQRVRQHQIDVLVDLTLHTGKNRLLTFARKPAPVQVTYLAYCGSSGIRTMDYRLTDPYFDPPGADESAYSEQSIRLPQTYWCYQPTGDEPEVNAVPAATAGHVTFGCLNSFAKVTRPTLQAWARLMQLVPDSRLLLHAPNGAGQQPLREFFAHAGVDPQRLTLLDTLPSRDYFAAYQRIDIALDPFPFGGGTTSCDALWMGVPLISWAGEMPLSRAGLSILSNVGLSELVDGEAQ
jgi:predicted O-linked N-acetylglucosamine transferase (SPINDLY family)